MVPVVPEAKGPLSCMESTSGFHCGQVAVSDQIFQTACGVALVSTDRSSTAIAVINLPESRLVAGYAD